MPFTLSLFSETHIRKHATALSDDMYGMSKCMLETVRMAERKRERKRLSQTKAGGAGLQLTSAQVHT